MENGSHLALALLGHDAPELVEIGIGVGRDLRGDRADLLRARKIQSVVQKLDDRALMTLKD